MPAVTPSRVVWEAEGRPGVTAASTPSLGLCAACGSTDMGVVSVTDVVSRNFTDWDRFPFDGGLVCVACGWAFRDAALRTTAQVVSPDGVVTGWPAALSALSGPLGVDVSVVVPVGGRKHLLPFAGWRSVSTDWGLLPWDRAAVELLGAVKVLRATGMPEGAIRAADGLPPVVSGVDPRAVLVAYDVVRDWRGSPHVQVALRVSRPPKAGDDVDQ